MKKINIKKNKSIESSKTATTVDFDTKTINTGHHKVTYKEISALKCPFDYVIYQMIIFKIKPDLIIEIGTNKGGGALYLADLLTIIGKGEVHTIDIKKQADAKVLNHKRIKYFHNGWKKYPLKETNKFKKIMIIEDSSHTYKNTLGVLNRFSHLVSKGSYFIIEDGIVNELGIEKAYDGGPLKAINEFLNKNKTYKIDYKWCNLFGKNATFNINGYLKKIK